MEVQVYGVLFTPEEIEQMRIDEINGVVRNHPKTYLEYSIPVELEKKLDRYIQKQIKKFEEKCNCKSCKELRK